MPNIEKAKNQAGKTIFPVTVADAVLMGNGKTLKGELTELGSKVDESLYDKEFKERFAHPNKELYNSDSGNNKDYTHFVADDNGLLLFKKGYELSKLKFVCNQRPNISLVVLDTNYKVIRIQSGITPNENTDYLEFDLSSIEITEDCYIGWHGDGALYLKSSTTEVEGMKKYKLYSCANPTKIGDIVQPSNISVSKYDGIGYEIVIYTPKFDKLKNDIEEVKDELEVIEREKADKVQVEEISKYLVNKSVIERYVNPNGELYDDSGNNKDYTYFVADSKGLVLFKKGYKLLTLSIITKTRNPNISLVLIDKSYKVLSIINGIVPTKDGDLSIYDLSSIEIEEDCYIGWHGDGSALYIYFSKNQPEGVDVFRSYYCANPTKIGDYALVSNISISHYYGIGYNIDVNEDKIDEIRTDIAELQDSNYSLIGNWRGKIQEIQSAQKDKFTFAIQTDTHYFTGKSKDIGNSMCEMTKFVGFDFVANLGDFIQGYEDEEKDNLNASRDSMTELMYRYINGCRCPFLFSLGNHDNNIMYSLKNNVEAMSNEELYGRLIKTSKNTNVKGVYTDKLYYYTDFEDIRVIVMNTNDGITVDGVGNQVGAIGMNEEQVEWFTRKALDTSKSIIVMSHIPLVNGWSVNTNYVESFAPIVASLNDFKNNGGTVIGCMYGHAHIQENHVINGINHILFKNSTSSENEAEVVMVDTKMRKIETITIGFNGNRSFTY